ncbi:hypothetical protein [Streptomyces sp. NPDC057702]|uniref:hypothetical protein n=1 Tax=unclassified Streptomyces TaxID=2593676 RepID=UPI00367A49FD
MSTRLTRCAAVASGVVASGLLVLGAGGAPAGAAQLPAAGTAQLPGVTFYTGTHATGTAMAADLDTVGACHELPASARSFRSIAERGVEVYFNADCRPGAPGGSGDLTYVVGTLGTGDFPYAAVSYRVRAN